MVSFPDAIKSAFSKYATFAGRASRAEFWWFAVFIWVIEIILYIPFLSSLPDQGEDVSGTFWLWLSLFIAFTVVTIIPYISVTVRRLHDTNKSGWWYWISLVPCIGGIWLLILLIMPGTPGPNQYGPNQYGPNH